VSTGLVLGVCGLVLAGCATTPPSPEALAANDPYEETNRDTLKLNGKIDKYFVIPTVGLYFILVPDSRRRGVHNFLGNLSLPTIFVNDMLQGEVSRAGKAMWRLVLNSTIGLGGFFDPASKIGIAGHGEDLGQTLAVWGAGEPDVPSHPGHPAQFGGLLFIPAQPVPAAAQRANPQRPQGEGGFTRLLTPI
jgi:phospholipid-binding lipoprotein MlaA